MKETIEVVKIGGGIMENEIEMNAFLEKFTSISRKKILVHGGGKGASEMLTKLKITPKMEEGRRVTNSKTLDVIIQLYAGLYNKKIVAKLQHLGCNAVGLSGADGPLILSKKREKKPVDFGFVGDPIENGVNTQLINLLLENNYTPICCAISMDKNGQLLNTNADTIASTIATALAKNTDVNLTYCFDKIGVLEDVNNPDSLIKKINKKEYKKLLEKGIINDGMKPKLENAFRVINSGVKTVRLCHSDNLNNFIGTKLKIK